MKLGLSILVFFTMILIGCKGGGGGSTSAPDCTTLLTDYTLAAETYTDAALAGNATGAQCYATIAALQAWVDGGCDISDSYPAETITGMTLLCAELP